MENRQNYDDVKKGFGVMVYEQNNISENNGGVRDTRLDLIGEEVTVEHGEGLIVALELFPTTYNSSERYLVKITNNTGTEILKSLFPKNELCYWRREIKFKNQKLN